MRITVNDTTSRDAEVLPAILDILPEGLSAWMSGGKSVIYDGDVEIASVSVRGLEPSEAVDAVRKALKGVI